MGALSFHVIIADVVCVCVCVYVCVCETHTETHTHTDVHTHTHRGGTDSIEEKHMDRELIFPTLRLGLDNGFLSKNINAGVYYLGHASIMQNELKTLSWKPLEHNHSLLVTRCGSKI